MPLNYTYCVVKLVQNDACYRVLRYSFRQNSCSSHWKPILFVHSRPAGTFCRKILNVLRDNYYLARRKYSLNLFENQGETVLQDLKKIPQDVLEKVKYNCILNEKSMKLNWGQSHRLIAEEKKQEQERRNKVPDIPFSLKYLSENIPAETPTIEEKEESVVLPFNLFNNVTNTAFKKNESLKFYSDRAIDSLSNFSEGSVKAKDWLKDHEFHRDQGDKNTRVPRGINYGTPDKSVPVSVVPCGGCGALLQCQDTGIPGYLPSELIKNCTTAELRAFKCQRCHFLEQFDMALNLSVSPDDYPRLLSHLKNEIALAIIMVDLTDFPCSLWPGILEIVGTKRPVIIVGNKVDLLPSDSIRFLSYAQSWLQEAVMKTELANANIKHVSLISAQTGFGVEELITKIHVTWKFRGDVYLLGCTNVGKSTLFNTFLKSDFCKVRAVDIMQRATTSPWPGTTLNLLKFPIFRPDGWKIVQRIKRLQAVQRKRHQDLETLRAELKRNRNPLQATRIGYVDCTFKDSIFASEGRDPFSLNVSSSPHVQLPGLEPNRKDFVQGKWCYDTPGTIHPDQIIDILTAQELVHMQPREMILPRTFNMYCGDTVLIGGLGRLDLEHGPDDVKFTVFAASTLPITVCRTTDADEVYGTLAASNLLIVPSSKQERLSLWPGLTAHSHPLEINGIHKRESSADIVLSSAGWIAVTPNQGDTCVVRAWTPFAKGIHLRQPPLLRFSVNLRGKKVRKGPAYLVGKAVSI